MDFFSKLILASAARCCKEIHPMSFPWKSPHIQLQATVKSVILNVTVHYSLFTLRIGISAYKFTFLQHLLMRCQMRASEVLVGRMVIFRQSFVSLPGQVVSFIFFIFQKENKSFNIFPKYLTIALTVILLNEYK